jgi:molecular chaperone DnaK (HSP70)
MWESPNKLFHVGCSGKAAAGSDVIGIDLGTTNSCVATMEGKVREKLQQYTVR